jgi:hypothetical protein
MTDFHDNDEPRDLRPHERDPDAEPPQVDEIDVALNLAELAGSQCAGDGATYAAEFLANLDVEHLNAMALALYAGNQSFRELFADRFGESVRGKLRDAA